MQSATRLVQFGPPNAGKPTANSRGGRICQAPDCDTILSIYNTLESCSLHEQRKLLPGSGPLSPR